MDETVNKILNMMSDDDREYFQERAAVREYDGKIKPREFAEALAILDILTSNPMALTPGKERKDEDLI